MSTVMMTERITDTSVAFRARIAGAFYLGTFVFGMWAFLSAGGRIVGNVVATLCYIAVTLLFYELFKPVNRNVSLIAALFSFLGLTNGALALFHLRHIPINTLVFFGVYCLLIGYLILRSTFLPHVLGVLMAFAGLGWLTFISPQLTHALAPINMMPGMIGEGALTLWLLIMGVNAARWNEQAGAVQ
jgi:hypothetical protein